MNLKSTVTAACIAASLSMLSTLALAADPFTEKDFTFDPITSLNKAVVVAGVNKLAKENANCKTRIDLKSVQYDAANASPDSAAFTVVCGEGDHKTTEHFSALDVGL